MLQIELVNAHPAVERTLHRYFMLIFRTYCCLNVLKVCWICRCSESLNQAPLTVISVKERRGWILSVSLQRVQSLFSKLFEKCWDFFQVVDKLVPQDRGAEGDRPCLVLCHSNQNMTFSFPLCWNHVQKQENMDKT